jgi:hypothetical protein
MPLGKALFPEKGFEPLYTNLSKAGDSYHMLAGNSLPYLFGNTARVNIVAA